MMKIESDRPFIGPSRFLFGEFTYQDKSYGDINIFTGRKIISLARNI